MRKHGADYPKQKDGFITGEKNAGKGVICKKCFMTSWSFESGVLEQETWNMRGSGSGGPELRNTAAMWLNGCFHQAQTASMPEQISMVYNCEAITHILSGMLVV